MGEEQNEISSSSGQYSNPLGVIPERYNLYSYVLAM